MVWFVVSGFVLDIPVTAENAIILSARSAEISAMRAS